MEEKSITSKMALKALLLGLNEWKNGVKFSTKLTAALLHDCSNNELILAAAWLKAPSDKLLFEPCNGVQFIGTKVSHLTYKMGKWEVVGGGAWERETEREQQNALKFNYRVSPDC